MERKTSYFARLLALIALIGAIVAVVLILQAALKNDDDDSSGKGRNLTTNEAKKQPKPKTKAATYTIQPEDTLTKIAGKTGVKVQELIELNPEIDPQILIAGETLKLR